MPVCCVDSQCALNETDPAGRAILRTAASFWTRVTSEDGQDHSELSFRTVRSRHHHGLVLSLKPCWLEARITELQRSASPTWFCIYWRQNASGAAAQTVHCCFQRGLTGAHLPSSCQAGLPACFPTLRAEYDSNPAAHQAGLQLDALHG